MKYLFSIAVLFLFGGALLGQDLDLKELPESHISKAEVEAHLRFLASDELRGRRTGSEGNNIAARYIAANLEALGFKPAPGADEGFFQYVYFEQNQAPEASTLTLHKEELAFGDDYIITRGDALDFDGRAVFAGYGWVDKAKGHDDYEDLDVEGKLVIVLPGTPEGQSPQEQFDAGLEKYRFAQEHGAAALLELYRLNYPWPIFRNYFGRSSMRLIGSKEETQAEGNEKAMPYGWIKDISDGEAFQRLKKGKKVNASFSTTGPKRTELKSQNVIGVLEGSDPVLKKEYVVISAHYDHIGVGKQSGQPYTEQDSIFNGARDDAFGVTAILAAARSYSQERPKRSILFAAFTAEENGLLGSTYFAENPLVPLQNIIFNANNDTPGYNDTSIISIFGFGRTGTDEHVEEGLAAFGLKVFPDPAPEQNLFDRSDNVSFAKKGIPALTFSPGFTSFDDEINKYYHQAADNPESINFDYLQQYAKAYTYAVRLIANDAVAPFWESGDKYEEAGKSLYQNKVNQP